MIPTIEDIISGLADGTITKAEALIWIKEHIRLANERGYAERDAEA